MKMILKINKRAEPALTISNKEKLKMIMINNDKKQREIFLYYLIMY